MFTRLFAALLGAIVLSAAAPAAQRGTPSDLDEFMARVLERRADNWKKLQQYVLDERETFQLVGPGGVPLYGFRNEYAWFPREGIFIRSPVRANGVVIDEGTRTREEAKWLEREQRREKRRAEQAAKGGDTDTSAPATPPSADAVTQSLEPQFVSAAYFLRFRLDPGQYALAGRERVDDREVLRIEYYPTKLFREGRSRPNRKLRERDDQTDEKMNKTSLVTFWIDPSEHQILRYEFQNVDMDFLPGRSLVRVNGVHASMHLGQPFPGVWLPQLIEMRFDLGTAMGGLDGRYRVDYHDYRLATVSTKVR